MQEQDLTIVNTSVISDKKKIADAVLVTAFLLFLVWTVFVLDRVENLGLNRFGLRPRSLEGLRGLFTIHFLHGDLSHIWHNSVSLLVMNSFLFYFYRSISLKVFALLFVVSGILLWIGGRPENHIGASMLIYGEAAFLFLSGLVRDNTNLLRVSLVVALYFGGLVWYLFPIDPHISWEGHLSGAIVGVALAFVFRGKGPMRKKYNWEIEEELELEREREEAQKIQEENTSMGSVSQYPYDNIIHYIYTENKTKDENNKPKPKG